MKVNGIIDDEINKHHIRKIFQETKSCSIDIDGLTASCHPFPHCSIANFLQTDEKQLTRVLSQLRKQLLTLPYSSKNNDLFSFQQTSELPVGEDSSSSGLEGTKLSFCELKEFSQLLVSKMHPWLQEVTGATLNNTINMFSAQYKSADYLLCHDDQLEARRFAYIYYLSPDWDEKDGGDLQLFNCQEMKQKSTEDLDSYYTPTDVNKVIIPKENMFVFFEVSAKSFHQVAEVLSESKTRLTLTGWFHGPTEWKPTAPPMPKQLQLFPYRNTGSSRMHDFINPTYLAFQTQAAIQEQFIDDSEIQLVDFLVAEKYTALNEYMSTVESYKSKYLESCYAPLTMSYQRVRDCYLRDESPTPLASSKNESLSQLDDGEKEKVSKALKGIQDIVDILCSEEFFLYLSNITGLTLHPLYEDSDNDEDDVPAKKIKSSEQHSASNGSKSNKITQEKFPTCCYELRRWGHRNFTLLRDRSGRQSDCALDAHLFFNVKDWRAEYGGCTIYVSESDSEELLTILPTKNCLSLAYRDTGAVRFTKYINHKAPSAFYDLAFSYFSVD